MHGTVPCDGTASTPISLHGVRVGVLLGTSYLFTREAVEHGAIKPPFTAPGQVPALRSWASYNRGRATMADTVRDPRFWCSLALPVGGTHGSRSKRCNVHTGCAAGRISRAIAA